MWKTFNYFHINTFTPNKSWVLKRLTGLYAWTHSQKIQAKTIWFARENALSFLLLQQIASCECFVCLGVMNRDGLTQYIRYIAILFAPYKQHKIIQNKNSSFCGKKTHWISVSRIFGRKYEQILTFSLDKGLYHWSFWFHSRVIVDLILKFGALQEGKC